VEGRWRDDHTGAKLGVAEGTRLVESEQGCSDEGEKGRKRERCMAEKEDWAGGILRF
jgi:hypothetical protein